MEHRLRLKAIKLETLPLYLHSLTVMHSLSRTVNTCSSSAGQQTLANFIKTTWKDLNDPATLYCSEPCSGVETWEKSGVKVAECGVKEESEFSCERHLDQSSLTVPQVNYTTRGFYHTKCSGEVICFQNLQPNRECFLKGEFSA